MTAKARILIVLIIMILTVQACTTCALADDLELLGILPGEWLFADYLQDAPDGQLEVDLAVLTLEKDGSMFLELNEMNGEYAYSCAGTWSFEFVPDGTDRLTLLFLSTNDPEQAGKEYHIECVYEVYADMWVENSTQYTYLVLTDISSSDVSPFEDVYGYNYPALSRKQGPNMRICNCKEWVSLRDARDTSATRLAKVPLGALVLAFPEYGLEGDFIYVVYGDIEGYILSKYLEPIQ